MKISKLEQQVKDCQKCELYKSRNNIVLGGGEVKSKIMLVGEAPGAEEDRQGKVFVGASGKLLDKMLSSIGLDRSKVYITNILKCRPPSNRNPRASEKDACIEHLREQYRIIQPKIIVLLGGIACKAILEKDFSLMRSHGEVTERKGTYFIPTFHPSALLRNANLKPLAYQDLKILRDLIAKENIL